jgi:hypothetical protein
MKTVRKHLFKPETVPRYGPRAARPILKAEVLVLAAKGRQMF